MWVSPIFWWQKSYLLLELWMPTTERELFSCKTGFQFSIYSYRDFAQHEARVWRDNIILVSAAFRLFKMWRKKISFLASSIECDFTSGWISLCFFCIREQHSSSISGTMMISRIQKQTSSRPKWECRTWNLWHFPIISILSFPTVDACWWFWHLFSAMLVVYIFHFLIALSAAAVCEDEHVLKHQQNASLFSSQLGYYVCIS